MAKTNKKILSILLVIILVFSLGISALASNPTPVKVHIQSGDKDQIDFIIVQANYDEATTPPFTSSPLTPVAPNNPNQWNGEFDGTIDDNTREIVGSVTIYWKGGGTSALPFHESAVGKGGNATLNITIASVTAPTYNVSYTNGETSFDGDNRFVGINYTVLTFAQTSLSAPTNQHFIGWSTTSPVSTTPGTAVAQPAENVLYVAQFAPDPTYTYDVQYTYYTYTDGVLGLTPDATVHQFTSASVTSAPGMTTIHDNAASSSAYSDNTYSKGTATSDITSSGTLSAGDLIFTVNYYRFVTTQPDTYTYQVKYVYYTSMDGVPNSTPDGVSTRLTSLPVTSAPDTATILSAADSTSSYVENSYSKGTAEGDVSATGSLTAGSLVFAVNYYRNMTTPVPGSNALKIIKDVTGTGASTSEKFEITVSFSSQSESLPSYENYSSSPVISNEDGSFTLSLSGGEYVLFLNLSNGTSYLVEETLTSVQLNAGWSNTSISNAEGSINNNSETSITTISTVTNDFSATPPPPPPPTPTPTPTPVIIQTGSLTVTKSVTGDEGPAGVKFAITVAFAPGAPDFWSIAGIQTSAAGANGVYELSLSNNEAVSFSNIPVGTTYTVTETLTNGQINSGWTGPASAAIGTISTDVASVTVTNTYTSNGVAGDSDIDPSDPDVADDPDAGVAGDTDILPQTGGISRSTLLGIFGLVLIAMGGTVLTISRKKNHD